MRTLHASNTRLFIDAYVEAMCWANVSNNEDDSNPANLSTVARRHLEHDAREFVQANYALIERAVTENYNRYGWDSAGHDYALTRNGHGAGFWDSGLGAVGDELTDMAQAYGESWLYVNDSGCAVVILEVM